MKKLNSNALGLSAGLLSGAGMLLLGILASFGVFMTAFEMMKGMHLFFDATFLGVIAGIIEAFVFSYVVGYLFAWLYNRLNQ
mgnify:CR=1 FL=1|jgi:hypothetical protein